MVVTGNNEWNNDNGNNTHAINYPLNENSLVVDLGGCYGNWAAQIIAKYNPYVLLLEPIPDLYTNLGIRFAYNPKVKIINCGIAAEDRKDILYYNDDGTSKYTGLNHTPVEVRLISPIRLLETIDTIRRDGKGWAYGQDRINLMQVNIEGEEYNLLDKMLEDNTVSRVDYLQIQFHTFIDNAETRRLKIQEGLSRRFDKLYDYPFVFEGWKNKNTDK